MVIDVAAGIIIASIPYFLIRAGWKLLRQDEFRWIATLDKIFGFVLILAGLAAAFFIVAASA